MKNKQLYIAYGSNINLQQMAYRCPHSRVAGTSEIKDFELEFRGVATIVPKKGASVPVLIWELDDKEVEGMAYLMNQGEIAPPSRQYYNTILQGYRENGLDKSYLQTALENSLQIEHMVNDEFDEEYCAEDYDGYYDIDDFQMKF